MRLIFTIASLIEWIAISYFAIPESIFRASQIQCEEWISGIETNFSQIIQNTSHITFSSILIPDRQALAQFPDVYKLTQR